MQFKNCCISLLLFPLDTVLHQKGFFKCPGNPETQEHLPLQWSDKTHSYKAANIMHIYSQVSKVMNQN